MLELNKPYSAEELAKEAFNITYGTFRNKKQEYLEKLSKSYKWEYRKRKYYLLEKISEYEPTTSKREQIDREFYLPKVIDNIGYGKWTTGTGVTVEIYEENEEYIVNELKHVLDTSYRHVLSAMKTGLEIKGSPKYAKCYGKGDYGGPDFMSKEEIEAWNKLKSSQHEVVGKKIINLTEDWAGKGYSVEEFQRKVGAIAAEGFALILKDWILEKGYIPVLLHYYEPKKIKGQDFTEIEIDFDF